MPNFKRGMMGAAGSAGAASYQLFTWGGDGYGSLGDGTANIHTARNRSPGQIGALETWVTLFINKQVGRAIKSDGTLWSWGRNHAGQVGDNSVISRSSPVQVGSATDWTDAKIGGAWSTFVVKSDGTLWVWGDNNYFGAGGFGESAIDRSTPTQLGLLTNWAQVSQGYNGAVVAVKTDGTMWAWGDGRYGSTGLSNALAVSSPTQIGSLTTWAMARSGVHFCAAIKTDGTLWTWGKSINGESGRSFASASAHTSSPLQVGALTTWSKVACGNTNVTAIKTDGTLWSWGRGNPGGSVGDNASIDRSSPVQLGSLTTWAEVETGDDVSVAMKTDGTIWAWGDGASYGKTGQGDLIARSSPIQIGSLTSWVAITAGGMTLGALREA